MKKNGKKLEDTIRELRQRYKNVPSPLSSTYNHMNENVHFVPQQAKSKDIRDQLLGGFKPQQQPRFY